MQVAMMSSRKADATVELLREGEAVSSQKGKGQKKKQKGCAQRGAAGAAETSWGGNGGGGEAEGDKCGKASHSMQKRGRCREALYCSADCQASAWKQHKKVCVKAAHHRRHLLFSPLILAAFHWILNTHNHQIYALTVMDFSLARSLAMEWHDRCCDVGP